MTNILHFDRMLGPSAPALGWVPAPRYLMRRARIRALMRDIPCGRLLEIGPGAGALLVENAQSGHQCEALETSVEARDLISKFIANSSQSIQLHQTPGDNWVHRFDMVCAFEVLEHIENDLDALKQWISWIRPGGYLLLSVPAHMNLWSSGDEWAGHFRRYERDGLLSMLKDLGVRVEVFECYGFPLTNLSEWISAPFYRRNINAPATEDAVESSESRKLNNDRSGTDRSLSSKLFPFLSSFPGKMALYGSFMVQDIFLNTDLGSGYMIKARI